MKNFYTLLLFLFATVSTFAQAPEKMSYQAVLRDGTNTLLTNQEVGMQISILQTSITGTSVYLETQTPTTNINGLVSIEIGTGTSSDDFSVIDWSAGPYFIKTATDPTGGTSYTITGTSQLMSVPFAMYAKTSGSSTPGPQGPTGAAGASGVTGADGANGEKGATGDQGAQGIQGETGSAGVDGTNGDNGDQGIQGIQGTAGTDGDTGVTGDQGAAGLTTAVNAIVQIDGNITITTTDIPEGDNKYYTDALVSANTAVADNTAKVGYTDALVSANTAVVDNTAKVGYTEALVSANTAVVANSTNTAILNDLIVALEARIVSLEQEATVGDLRAGGVVFWVDPVDSTQGLVCALQDYQSIVAWGCEGIDLLSVPNVAYNGGNPVGSGAEIGDGESNTTGILADCSSSPAALAARSYGAEWFLPSAKELNVIYKNRAILEAVSGVVAFSNYYWSSTEFDSSNAWYQDFGNGNQDDASKSPTKVSVRAVRAF